MPMDRIQRNMLIVLVIGLLAMAIMAWRVDHALTDLDRTLVKMSEDVRASKPAPKADDDGMINVMKGGATKVVSQHVIRANDGVLRFMHLCDGQVDVTAVRGEAYCVGMNQLVLAVDDKKPLLLTASASATGEESPLFADAVHVPASSGPGTVLLSYGPNPCLVNQAGADCGVDADRSSVTYAYDLRGGDAALASVSHVPADGSLFFWNPAGTRAVVIPDTCGGAGCGETELIGYDLATDAVRPVTAEKAAWSGAGSARNDEGDPLPVWASEVTWNSDVEFSASIIGLKNNQAQAVSGKF